MTPLNCIVTFSRAFLTASEISTAKEYGKLIERTAKLLKHNMRDLLDRNLFENDRFVPALEPTIIVLVVEEVLAILQPQAQTRGVTLNLSLDRTQFTTKFKPLIDGARVQQILINLISNAIKFSETGDTIEIGLKAQEEDGKTLLRLMVQD